MKRLLLTTVLATLALAGTPYAQTPPAMPDITVPEGFGLNDSPLTAATLLGATIHDSSGDAIGAVADLVFDTGAAGMTGLPEATGDAAMPATTQTDAPAGDTATTHEGMNPAALDGATAEGLDGATSEQVVPGTNDAVNGVGGGTAASPATNAANAAGTQTQGMTDSAGQEGQTAAEQEANPDNPQVYGGTADQANTDVDGSDTDGDGTIDTQMQTGTTAEQVEDMVAAHEGVVGTDGTVDDGTMAEGTAEGIGQDAAGEDMAQDGTMTQDGATTTDTGSDDIGQITHAVLDIGGFLGLGQHRVAIPITDLTLYANGDEIRVYLPWTRAQLEALPGYDPADPATLGTSPWHDAD